MSRIRIVSVVAMLAFCVSSGAALAANKLIVKGTDGTTDKFVVTDSGSVGIGTGSPVFPFNIVGGGDATASLFYMYNYGRDSAAVNDSPCLLFFRNNVAAVNSGLPRNGDRLGYFAFGSKIGGVGKYSSAVVSFAEGTYSPTSNPGYLSFQTTSVNATGTTEKVRIASSGNVGIGTSAPVQKLDVNGGIRLNSTGTKPTCVEAIRGTLWLEQGTTDVLQICVQAGAGSFFWRTVTLQ